MDQLIWGSAGGLNAHYKAAITAQVSLLTCFGLCILVPLGRWNDQPGISVSFSSGNMILGGAIGGGQLLLLIGTVRRLKPLLWFGLLGVTVWLFCTSTAYGYPYILGFAALRENVCVRLGPHYQAPADLRDSPSARPDAHLY